MSSRTPIVGMEIHVELKTASKMFCGCKNDPFHAEKPNTHTCPVCLGMPGGLPVANKKAVDWTIKLGLALGCEIAQFSKFDRKHYFYPDLSKGYQISQYDQPLAVNGLVKTSFGDVRITRVHLEEDTGKLQHTEVDGKHVSLIDFNRSGVPLVEIVTEPDIHSAEQAKEYAKKIQQVIRSLEISDVDMEKGSMRLEANISLADDPNVLPNYKVEVKNINSFRFLEQAIVYEIERQTAVLDKSEVPPQETRGWSEAGRKTVIQRSKENAKDYRYFADPDLPPMVFSDKHIAKLRGELPKMPDEIIEKYSALGIRPEFLKILVNSYKSTFVKDLFEFAEINKVDLPKFAAFVVNKKFDLQTHSSAQVIHTFQSETELNVIDPSEIKSAIEVVLSAQSRAVTDYKSGKTQVIGFLIGMVTKQLGKKADPNVIREELLKHLI